MKAQSNIRFLSLLRWFVKIASLIASVVGAGVLIGWLFDIPTLKGLFSGLPAIRFNAALSFLLLGSSLWLLQDQEGGPRKKRIGNILAGIVLMISLLTICEYLFGWDLGIDQLFVRDVDSPLNLFPGRMSPIAALGTGFCSVGLLRLGSKTSQYLAMSASGLSLATILSYASNLQLLSQRPEYTYVAFYAGVTLLLISLATIAARPTYGMMRILTSNLPGSRAMRLMLPGMLILTLLMGWLVEQGQSLGVLDSSEESILLGLLLVLVYSPLIYISANSINKAEERILYLNRLYATLSQVNQTIVRVKSQQELFESICRVAVEFGQFRLAWIGLFNHATGQVTPVAEHGQGQNQLPFQNINAIEAPFDQGLIGISLRSGSVAYSSDIQTDPHMKHWRELALKGDYHSAAVVPVQQHGQIVVLLNLYAADVGYFLSHQEQSLLEEMGRDISFALDTLESEAERKQAEERSHESEELFRTAFQYSPVGMCLTTLDGKLQNVNQALADMLGFIKEELEGKHFNDITHPEDMEIGRDALKRMVSGEVPSISFEKRYVRMSGEAIWAYVGIALLRDSSRKPLHFITQILDITERKRVEAALWESQARLSFALEKSRMGGWDLDLVDHTVQRSPQHDRIFGYESLLPQWTYEMFLDHVIPDDRIEVDRRFQEAVAMQTDWNFECRIRRTDDKVRWIWATGGHQYDHTGHSRHMAGFVQDITEHKQAEAELRESERQMRALVTSLDDIVFEFDEQGTYLNIWANDESLLAEPKSQLIGKRIVEVLGEVEGSRFADAIKRALASGIPESIEYALEVIGGQRWFMARISPIVDSDGTYRTASMLVRNITKRKQVEEELRTLNDQLEQRVADRTAELNQTNAELEHANRVKDEFLANMSHELRTPLNSILGLSESMLEERRGSLNDYQQKSLQIIESSGQHLLELINDILDLSKIEAGKFDYYPQLISVNEICRSSLTFVKSQAAKKSITVTYNNAASVTQIYADPRRLKQILVNLLTNAVKFTFENGNVTLQVSCDPVEELIRFSVIDNGIGIASEDLQRLFQPFVQADSSLNRQHEGTGLGLALVQKLTDLHGGSVHVESAVGKGSRFTINLSCKQANTTKLEQFEPGLQSTGVERSEKESISSEAPAQHPVIVLAEDNMSNILTVGEYLESHGYEIIVAHDGMEAIARAEEASPDLILMDIQMPTMNGLEAMARLRGNPRFAS
ncbi:MAG TPA: PAS domain S-box protein, partial [Anaerolineales bacterium]|nr:PAS domain S-box protein [Anaerolineales bacterium]